MAEVEIGLDIAELSRQLEGLVVADLTQSGPDSIALRFTNAAVLVLGPKGGGLSAVLRNPPSRGDRSGARSGPTRRQQEYLEFIQRYIHRFGYSPAETDIERHFLVSAPSVNTMIRTLERRGFIERSRDWSGRTVPRSIRVVWDG
jgi:hypothetical protein